MIHRSSAVSSRCKEVFVWTISDVMRNKKKIIKTFISPKNKIKYLLRYLLDVLLCVKLIVEGKLL